MVKELKTNYIIALMNFPEDIDLLEIIEETDGDSEVVCEEVDAVLDYLREEYSIEDEESIEDDDNYSEYFSIRDEIEQYQNASRIVWLRITENNDLFKSLLNYLDEEGIIKIIYQEEK